jgi:hypothetical protein
MTTYCPDCGNQLLWSGKCSCKLIFAEECECFGLKKLGEDKCFHCTHAALTQPQPVMGEDGIIEVINKAIADADIILKRSGDAATPIYRALKSSGIIKTDGGK